VKIQAACYERYGVDGYAAMWRVLAAARAHDAASRGSDGAIAAGSRSTTGSRPTQVALPTCWTRAQRTSAGW